MSIDTSGRFKQAVMKEFLHSLDSNLVGLPLEYSSSHQKMYLFNYLEFSR